jgi:polyhydroxybutyrate depolymerase
MRERGFVGLLLFFTLACGGEEPSGDAGELDGATRDGGAADATTSEDAGLFPPETLGPEARPARLVVPPAHDGTTPLPLVVLLHGYSVSAALQDLYLGLSAVARELGFYLVLPDGTVDSSGNRFWNATDFCCDFDGAAPDDVAYLSALVDEAKSVLPVDAGRVYFMGHSNGGFMSYRMACERADVVTAIAALAGTDFVDDMGCVPSEGVSVLHLHGDMDDTIAYEGTAAYASARATAERWAARAGCDPTMTTAGEALDLDGEVPGAETTVTRWETGCDPGLDVELRTIVGGSHIPTPTPDFTPGIAAWLLAHAK